MNLDTMTFDEVKNLLWSEHPIETEQREKKHNVNYQNLPYDKEDIPKIPIDYYFDKGNIFISKQYRYALVPQHTHAFVEFNYMLSGTSKQIINGEEFILEQGDILLFDRESVHEIAALGEDDILINILLQEESITTDIIVNMVRSNSLVNQFLMDASNSKANHDKFLYFNCSENNMVQEIMKSILIEYYSEKKYYIHSISLQLSVLLIELTRVLEKENIEKSANFNGEIIEILKYIDNNSKDINLETLSKFFGYNPNYLSNKIKKETGKSVQSLVNYSRYQSVLELMSNSDKTFEEIAFEVGFKSVPSLYKLIAKYSDLAPSSLRKTIKAKQISIVK